MSSRETENEKDVSVAAGPPTRAWAALLLVLSLIILGAALGVMGSRRDLASPTSQGVSVAAASPPGPDLARLESECVNHVTKGHLDDQQAIEESLAAIDSYFDRVRPRGRPMVDDLGDLGSSIKLVHFLGRDTIDGGERTRQYVKQFLSAYLDAPRGIEQAFADFQAGLVARLNAGEEILYASIEPELKPLVVDLSPSLFRGRCIDRLRPHLVSQGLNAGMAAIGAQVASELVGTLVVRILDPVLRRVLVQAVTRVAAGMGVRAGMAGVEGSILAAGASQGWWSGGLSLAGSVVVAVLVDWIIGEITAAEMAARLDGVLGELHREMRAELREQARRIIDDVHQARRDMIVATFHPEGARP
jgi:hypothetical protein